MEVDASGLWEGQVESLVKWEILILILVGCFEGVQYVPSPFFFLLIYKNQQLKYI
jgi:hypothetical protein